jgi:hypothetical protein
VKDWLAGLVRMLIVAITTSFIILMFLIVAYGGQTRQEQETLDETRRGTLATVCVLALPVDDFGRDDAQVHACLRKYGLEP